MAGDTQLATVEKFCYLESFLSNTISVDDDITSRLCAPLASYRIDFGGHMMSL